MTDLKLAAQVAIFVKLNAAPAVTGLAPVYEYVPSEQDGEPVTPPYIVIDRMAATPQGGKGGMLDLIEFDILTVVRQPGREFLTPVMAAVRDTLEEASLVSTEAILSPPQFVGDEDELLENGQDYLGRQRFSTWAQPKN